MSYEVTDFSVSYAGNNSTSTVYAITFGYESDSDIKATVDGAEFLNFELVTGGARTTTAVPGTSTIVFYRDTPETQPRTFLSGVLPTPPEIEAALNRLTKLEQETRARSLRLPAGETIEAMPPAATRAGKIEKWSDDGTEREVFDADEVFAGDIAEVEAAAAAAQQSAETAEEEKEEAEQHADVAQQAAISIAENFPGPKLAASNLLLKLAVNN